MSSPTKDRSPAIVELARIAVAIGRASVVIAPTATTAQLDSAEDHLHDLMHQAMHRQDQAASPEENMMAGAILDQLRAYLETIRLYKGGFLTQRD